MDAFPCSTAACMRERQNLTYPSPQPEHTAQPIWYCKSQTDRCSPLPPASFLALLLSHPHKVERCGFCFGLGFLGGCRDSKNTVVVIWTYSKTCLKYSYPGPNVFPISSESTQCFGILLAAYPSLCHPACMHTPIALAAPSAEAITNASGKAKIQR